MRADTAVPVGERSILPGSMATAWRARSLLPSRLTGPANRQKEKYVQPGYCG